MSALALLWSLAFAAAGQSPSPATDTVLVPLRDGVRLGATLLRPAGEGRFPTLVYRTPYSKDNSVKSYATFGRAVERGYAVVAVDVRGRYTSEGEYLPYQQEGKDGYDVIEWAATQPWSDGSVGTFGLSYPGAVQWLAAIERPPHLKAMVPAMTFASPMNFWYSGGVFDLSWPTWIWLNIAPDLRARKQLPGLMRYDEAAATWGKLRDEILVRLPISNVPELDRVAPWYFEWMKHPPGDPWWDWAELRNKYDRVSAAVLNISGWHDEAYGPDGATTNFAGPLRARVGQPDPRAFLIVGPWVHGIGGMTNRTAEAHSGQRVFGATAGVDYDEEILRFMDRYVRGVDNGLELGPRVRVFVMGENVWRTGDRWPLAETSFQAWYLGRAADASRGTLSRSPKVGAPTSAFLSDPTKPVSDPFATETGAHDYRSLAERSDLQVFETEPLTQDVRVVGNIRGEIFVSVDAPDTDLWVKLFDVEPDGTAWNLMSPGLDVLRASYRNGGPERELLEPGKVYRLDFRDLLTGNQFKRGHRIRVILAAAFAPHFSRNLHTGRLETESAESRNATITIHHSALSRSRIVLPVIP